MPGSLIVSLSERRNQFLSSPWFDLSIAKRHLPERSSVGLSCDSDETASRIGREKMKKESSGPFLGFANAVKYRNVVRSLKSLHRTAAA